MYPSIMPHVADRIITTFLKDVGVPILKWFKFKYCWKIYIPNIIEDKERTSRVIKQQFYGIPIFKYLLTDLLCSNQKNFLPFLSKTLVTQRRKFLNALKCVKRRKLWEKIQVYLVHSYQSCWLNALKSVEVGNCNSSCFKKEDIEW